MAYAGSNVTSSGDIERPTTHRKATTMAAATPRKTTSTRPPVADRKPKQASAAQKAEALGQPLEVEVRGLALTISRDAMDDYEVIEGLNTGNYFPVLSLAFSPEDVEKIKDLLRDEQTGRVKYTDVGVFLGEVFEAANPNS